MITVEQAKERIAKLNPTQRTIQLALKEAMNLVLAEDIFSPIQMPPFDQSAMDGYALKLGDSLRYTVIGEVAAGGANDPSMQAGDAVRIFTGAAVPTDADAVIMQEKTRQKGSELFIEEAPFQGQNIRPLGEQIKKGDLALPKGSLLTPAAVGFLAGLGVAEVRVFQKPKISIVITGSELVQAGKQLERGEIYESNGIMLEAVLRDNGFEAQRLVQLEDDYNTTINTLKKELNDNDFLIVSGGISVGDYDFVGKALIELGVKEIFYKVRQKPGKPMFLGTTETCSVFALPGNPAAALSCFYEYVLTALKQAMGLPNFALQKLFLPLSESYHKKGNRAHFLKAKISNASVQILQKQSSAMLFSFAQADALVYIPEDKMQTEAGDLVEVHLLP